MWKQNTSYKCTDVSKAEYNYRTQIKNVIPNLTYDELWVCPKCILTYQVEHFPCGLLNGEDIVNLYTSSSMCLHDMIPVFDPNLTSSVINDLAHNDVDVNLPLSINCKYYSNDEFSRLPVKEGSLNLFHTNVNGLESHFDNQETTITDSNLHFNAICITENDEFKRNINLENFHPVFSIHNIHSDVKNFLWCSTGLCARAIYINDLPNISDKLEFFLFADDTNIYYEANDLDSIQRVMNDELKKLQDWLITNRLALNISKTNFTIFSAPNKPLKYVTLLMSKKAIEEKKCIKYLGVIIYSKLSFFQHTGSIKNIYRGLLEYSIR